MPKKTGRCEISGCRNTPTDWHHVISQNQIRKRGLPKSFFTDPGNLKEYCRKHHDMTTASMDRKRLEKQAKKKVKAKPKKKAKKQPTWAKRKSGHRLPKKKAKRTRSKRTRCNATTKGETELHIGRRCKLKALPDEHYCGIHLRMGWGK